MKLIYAPTLMNRSNSNCLNHTTHCKRAKMLWRVTDQYQVFVQVSSTDGCPQDLLPMIQYNGGRNGYVHDSPEWIPRPKYANGYHNGNVCVYERIYNKSFIYSMFVHRDQVKEREHDY
eukprot:1082974_1